MMTTQAELIERLGCWPTAHAPLISLKRWYGFGMTNLTLRFRGKVVLKLSWRSQQ